jgi:hypothetical protein
MKRVFLALLTFTITAIPLTASATPKPLGDGSYIDEDFPDGTVVQCGELICWTWGSQKDISKDIVEFEAMAEFELEGVSKKVVMQVNCTNTTQKIVKIEQGDRWKGFHWEKTKYDWSQAFPWLADAACTNY